MQKKQVEIIADRMQLSERKILGTLQLLQDGSTIPFIARYRKEATGSLDEVQIASIEKEWKRLQELEKRRETILKTIGDQGKLTENLRQRVLACYELNELEDLYLPFKPKRRTRGTMAKEKGLEPLARVIFKQQDHRLQQLAASYLKKEVPNVDEALQGARDIMAEWINEQERARSIVRKAFAHSALISCKVIRSKREEAAKYQDYFDYHEPLRKCPSHRMLAIRRGEAEGYLRISLAPEEEPVIRTLNNYFLKGRGPASREVELAIEDAYKRLLEPSIETEFRQSSKSRADEEAINVFATNLQQLLLAPPLGQKKVLGIDPGFRTGCKLVCLDENGDLLREDKIFPHPPQSNSEQARRKVQSLVQSYAVEAIAIGNGTAGRETMAWCQKIDFGKPVEIFLVNEAGASIYSASDVAREEFPDYDVTVRGAVSIGRRLMDPLAELVKIDPKSIGVGQYQHDVNQVQLRDRLTQVVEQCVNQVGVNLNTASKHLLMYISGLGPTLAQNIINFRSEISAFHSREELNQVPRMGAKAFEQSAGFLRIRNGKNPLDNTAVHPERYPIVERMAKDMGVNVQALIQNEDLRKKIDVNNYISKGVGLPTLQDILKELEKPGMDPRGEAKAFQFANIHSIDDLSEGMVVPGVINNITNFGAFVDIGIKESGLVHISQLANRFIKNPAAVVSLNQQVKVRIIEIDRKRSRIQLSMKDV